MNANRGNLATYIFFPLIEFYEVLVGYTVEHFHPLQHNFLNQMMALKHLNGEFVEFL